MNSIGEEIKFDDWRSRARLLLQQGVAPEKADWAQSPSLFMEQDFAAKPLTRPVVTSEFLELAQYVACVRDADRWSLLYRLIYRMNHENKNLLKVSVNDDVRKADVWAKSVSRDIHKMHAFVRFKKKEVDGQETYVAWHNPEHRCLELAAPFFVRRFGDRPWSIFTPDLSAHWDLKELSFSKGILQNEFEHTDSFDELWTTYYKSIFNPARLKVKMMKTEMPVKYWASMPETAVIQQLIRETPKRLQNMAAVPRYLAEVPENASWSELREKAKSCAACPIAGHATQTVFGEGNLQAELMIVGEQPGDEEDRSGKIFVGPAGEVLSEALEKAGISRESIYLTNAVKHFKWEPQDKERLHKKANGREMQACKPWLEAEIARVKPKVILALGMTAGTALYGRLVNIQKERGQIHRESPFAAVILTSWHPAAILRAQNKNEELKKFEELVADLYLAHNRCQATFPDAPLT